MSPRHDASRDWKRARGEREGPHPVFVDHDRHRVICRECTWYKVKVGASYLELRALGRVHRDVMRGAEQ